MLDSQTNCQDTKSSDSTFSTPVTEVDSELSKLSNRGSIKKAQSL